MKEKRGREINLYSEQVEKETDEARRTVVLLLTGRLVLDVDALDVALHLSDE